MTLKWCGVIALSSLFWTGLACARPVVFWFNDPVGPDETVLLTGADLDKVTRITISRVPDAESAGGPAAEATVPIQQANPLSLKFVVPADLTPGVYRVTAVHPEGSFSLRLNMPTVYWIQSDLGGAASPGGWVQVFGRNIIRDRERARLVLQPDDARPAIAVTGRGGIWRGRFELPQTLLPGSYRLQLFNGDGDSESAADVGRLRIEAIARDPSAVFDVRAFGANGEGTTDSLPAVNAALDAASRAGGVVYFPRGRYRLSAALIVPSGVRIKGERTDLVNLVWPNFTHPPAALIRGSSRFAIEDVTIYAASHLHVISGGFRDEVTEEPGAHDIAIRRVRIRASAFRGFLDPEATARLMADFKRRYPVSQSPDAIRLSGDRLEVTDCDVVSSGRSLFLFKASNAVIAGNLLNNGRYGWYSITGSRRIIFENNVVSAVDLQGNGGSINTLAHGSRSVSASESVFVGGNTFKGLYGLDREGVTTDGPGGYYFGRAESLAPDRLSLRDAWQRDPVSDDAVGALVMVVNGPGTGQHARVAGVDRTATPNSPTIVLDRPLQVALAATSEIAIAQAQQNYLIVGNTFEDSGVAVQSFGTAVGHVIAANRSTRTGGFFAVGLVYHQLQPSWQIQFLDNRITEGNFYQVNRQGIAVSEEAVVGLHAYQAETRPGRPPLVRAMIVRGNQLEQDAHIEIKGVSKASPGIRDVVVEGNTIGASRKGIRVDAGVAWWLARRNIMGQQR